MRNLYFTGRCGVGKSILIYHLSGLQKFFSIDDSDSIFISQLGNFFRFFELPCLSSSNGYQDNINRVALLMPQIEDEYSAPPAVEMHETDTFSVKDFSDCKSPKDEPKTEITTVGQWQSDAQQDHSAPEIIVYVNAPHMGFMRADRQYLTQLLQTWKKHKKSCIVIPVLNIFEKDGRLLPTPENIEDTNNGIKSIYQKVYGNEWYPPIIEINSLKGTGIEQLTDIICQILPQEKIGNMQQVLRDDLKQHAEKEHVNRYYRTLSIIAGRLVSHTGDKKLEGQNMFQAATFAIITHGFMTFNNADAIVEIKKQMDAVIERVKKVENEQSQNITEHHRKRRYTRKTRCQGKSGNL